MFSLKFAKNSFRTLGRTTGFWSARYGSAPQHLPISSYFDNFRFISSTDFLHEYQRFCFEPSLVAPKKSERKISFKKFSLFLLHILPNKPKRSWQKFMLLLSGVKKQSWSLQRFSKLFVQEINVWVNWFFFTFIFPKNLGNWNFTSRVWFFQTFGFFASEGVQVPRPWSYINMRLHRGKLCKGLVLQTVLYELFGYFFH